MNLLLYMRIKKNLLLRDKNRSIKTIKKYVHPEKMYVFANGPSLSMSIDEIENDFSDGDIICMNLFPLTDYFWELKPKYLILFDPFWFEQESIIRENPQIIGLIDAINMVTWNLIVIIPEYAKTTYIYDQMKKNNSISVFFSSDFRVSIDKKDSNEKPLFELLKKDRICFPSQSVACAAIAFGIFMNYKRIDIIGLDMSKFLELEVNQKNNNVYLEDKHFYDNDKPPIKGEASIGWYLSAYAKMFHQMEFLNRYAEYCGVSVVNRSYYSYVDAFSRM